MSSIKELAAIFGGVIAEYVDCADFDEKAEPHSELLKSLIASLYDAKKLTNEQIDYSCSPVLYHDITWDNTAFNKACGSGHLKFAKWLVYAIPYNIFITQNIGMRDMKFNEYLDSLNRLKERCSSDNDLLLMTWFIKGRSDIDIMTAFQSACENSQLNIAKWIKEQWPYINYKARNNKLFRVACENGHLEIARWLKESWPDINHSGRSGLAFLRACYHGHLEVAKWLKNNWPDSYRQAYNDAFRAACIKGHLEVAQWLKYNWPDIDHRIYTDLTFRHTCENGHLNVAQWLKTNWPDIDHRAERDAAFQNACLHGHLDIAKWLKTTFHMSNIRYEEAFRGTCHNNHLHVAKWIREQYDINRDVYKKCYASAHLSRYHELAEWLREMLL